MLAAFGGPDEALSAAPGTLRELCGPVIATALAQEPDSLASTLAAVDGWLAGGDRRRVLALGEADYPRLLLETADPPLLIYLQGDLRAFSASAVAIVGSRRATPQGLANARQFGRELASAGFVVISGLALGIDAAAHEGALEAAVDGPVTLAVMGTGPEQVYPRRHQALAARIEARGALLTEFTPGTPPLAAHFPQRNRLIAGLARGTLVVEAALQSGSLITARLASEAGREVYALPGSIHAEQSRGCHELLRQGAMLVESTQEIIEDLRPIIAGTPRKKALAATPASAEAVDDLLRALGAEVLDFDALTDRTGLPANELNARLLEHELDGRIARLPGGLYQRIHQG